MDSKSILHACFILALAITNSCSTLEKSNPPPLPSSTAYTAYELGPVCQPSSQILTPQSVDELVSIVEKALATNSTVKAFGHRHSATDIICTDGTPVDMRGFKSMSFNATDNTATFGAGVYLREACEFMQIFNRGLKTTPGFGGITIGGAIGTGAHGSSIKWTSSISEQVVGVTIVNGLGKLQQITAQEDLQAFRIHLGLLGLVVNVTLKTVPIYKVTAHNYVVSDSILTDGTVIDMATNSDQISLYWFPSAEQVVVANWTIVDLSTPGDAYTFDHVPSTSTTFNLYSTQTVEVAQSLNSYATLNLLQAYLENTLVNQDPDFVPIYTEDGVTVKNPATGLYHLMFAPTCNESGWLQCPWFHGPTNITFLDNEIGIDLINLPTFVAEAKSILNKSPAAFPLQGILIRFSGASNTYMSRAYGVNTAHVEWYTMKRTDPYNHPSAGIAAYQAMMQSMVRDFGGRSHWGKSGLYYQSAPVLAKTLNATARQAFTAKMKQYDPKGVFVNDFGRRLLGQSTKVNFDPLTQHCALLDNCVCSSDTDCADGQLCKTLNSFKVCETPRLLPVLFSAPPPLPFSSMVTWMQTINGFLG